MYEHSTQDIKNMLHRQIHDVASYLLPGGVEKNGEWCVGSLDCEPGESLKLRLQGDKIGVWFEFNGAEGGDIINLWARRFNLSDAEAILDIRQYLGIPLPQIKASAARKFVTPELKAKDLDSRSTAIFSYLVNERKLSLKTLSKYQIKEDGRWMVFPYYKGGKLIFVKKIHLDRDADGKKQIHASKDSEPGLFGLDVIPRSARSLVIVEGEIDAMTLDQYDLGYGVVSVPFGGGGGAKQAWVQYVYDLLTSFDVIYLCLDDDDAGTAGTLELISRLGRHRCKVVTLPYKDANECLQKNVSREVIVDCFTRAKSLDPEQLISATTYKDELIRSLNASNEDLEGYTLPFPKAQNTIRFRPSELTVWTGRCGHGKSMMLGHVMLGAMQQGAKVCIASLEMKPITLLKRMLRQASGMVTPSDEYTAAIMDWYADKLWLYKEVGTVKPDVLLDTFTYAHHRYGVDTFVIDSLMMCGVREDDYNGQKELIAKLCAFKNEFNCHIHLVAHPRKSDSNSDEKKNWQADIPDSMDIKGSGTIVDLADNCLTVWANKHHDENPELYQGDEHSVNRALKCSKQRNGEWNGLIHLWFDDQSLQYLDNKFKKPIQIIDYSNREFR